MASPEQIRQLAAEMVAFRKRYQRSMLIYLALIVVGFVIPQAHALGLLGVLIALITGLIYQSKFNNRHGYQEAKDLARTGDYAVIRDSLAATDTRTCPQCAETIKIAALKCRFCGAEV